ncbi:M90 family metallopeptidase [Rhodohalobacter sp. 8-1]|uniref:M90 family metallopeptidase n=1 Tax=Rhodohalobacter sp. 8-1 TaxID=3131972 RepID=UPI0030EDB73A
MPFLRSLKRYFSIRRPLPAHYKDQLQTSISFYRYLNASQKSRLEKRMSVLLSEKIFEGCGGLTVTDEMKGVISAYAGLLIMEKPSDYYSDLRAILIYPDDYVAPVYQVEVGGVITEGSERRQGESWDSGSVVLSWSDIRESTLNRENNHNLIIHEFAHQLDDQYGLSAGITLQGKPLQTDDWTGELAKIYRDLIEADRFRRREHPLDLYGATNPAECFAVTLEAFIESPRKLQSAYGAAYRLLADFFGYDPGRIWDF